MNTILEKTDFKNLGKKYTGKVRDVYTQNDKVILVSTDRYSAFDRNLALIPYKGQVLTQVSKFWFEQTGDIAPNHTLDFPDPNVVVGQKCTLIPVEVVVRGYITGVTGTALWVLYQQGKRDFGDFVLPDGMHKNQKLEKTVVTPTTKLEAHDRPVTRKEILAEGLVEEKVWNRVEEIAVKLFERGQKIAAERGLILVDTKYEFGFNQKGDIVIIDEIHTPDSSRYWQAATYQERIAKGLEPENFDKEFLRLWFKEHCDPYKDKVLPAAPEEMVTELSRRYVKICEQITGKKFEGPKPGEDIATRIENNLHKYRI